MLLSCKPFGPGERTRVGLANRVLAPPWPVSGLPQSPFLLFQALKSVHSCWHRQPGILQTVLA